MRRLFEFVLYDNRRLNVNRCTIFAQSLKIERKPNGN